MKKGILLFLLAIAMLFSGCASEKKQAAENVPERSSESMRDYTGEDYLKKFTDFFNGAECAPYTAELALKEADDPGYRIIRHNDKKTVIASFQNDGIIMTTTQGILKEENELCCNIFAAAMTAFSSSKYSFEDSLQEVRQALSALSGDNTKTVFRDYARFEFTAKAGAGSGDSFVFFIVGPN